MPRKKRTSQVLTQAEKRFSGAKAISADLDLGSGVTVQGYQDTIETLRQNLTAYNELVSLIDQAANSVEAAERAVRNYSERILLGVAHQYGKDSNEYEMAGGVRKSERKRPTRRPQPVA